MFTKDKSFYKNFFSLYWVIVLQNVIVLGVALADNIMIGGYSQDEAANFFVGALLHDDIASVASIAAKPESKGKPVVVGGSDPLKTVFMILLAEAGADNLVAVPSEVATLASNYGAMRVYEAWKDLR